VQQNLSEAGKEPSSQYKAVTGAASVVRLPVVSTAVFARSGSERGREFPRPLRDSVGGDAGVDRRPDGPLPPDLFAATTDVPSRLTTIKAIYPLVMKAAARSRRQASSARIATKAPSPG
jgi:hypothetical protein